MTSSITSFSYHNPTAIEFGWGALARLPELVKSVGGRRVLVVGDPGVAKAGLVERVVSALGGAFPVTIFTDVESGENYGALMATAAILTAPLMLGFLMAQRHFIRGITTMGLK